MRGVLLWLLTAFVLAGGSAPVFARPVAKDKDPDALTGPALTVGGLSFTIPAKWLAAPFENPARAGVWSVPPPRGQESDAGEVVVLYFGPGVGGAAKENIEAWIGTMFDAEGHPAAAKEKHRDLNGMKLSQVAIFGTYNQLIPLPGVPPALKMNYGLLGAVIEGPQGAIYWRFTGPESLITANLALFNKIMESAKLPAKPS